MQKSLEISMKKFQGKKLSKSYCKPQFRWQINFTFFITYTYANTVNTRIATKMKHNMIRYCKWNVKEHPKRGNNVDITNIFNYGKDTIHKRMELFLSAPRNPIIDLKVKGKKTYMWSLGNKRGREKISSKIRHQYRLKRKVKLTLQR